MTLLAIETSCDETAAAIVEEVDDAARPWVIRSSVVASQVEIHREWGGVVPELASRQHVRDVCGYPGLIFGTIMANSPATVQSRLDVVDGHAYWQHPQFPGTPWDPVNWFQPNVSMVNTLGDDNTLAGLARQRVRGKPFTVTEYQHPSPNYYGAEGPLLLAA